MTGRKSIPWIGIAFAAATAIGMILSGASAWLALGVAVIWIGSLWLIIPETQSAEAAATRRMQSSLAIRAELIEPLSMPLILFDRDRIVAANASARKALGDHIIGQDPRIAFRHPDAVRLIDMPDSGEVTIRGLTDARSVWALTRRRINDRYWTIELDDRTTEADISRAHTDFVANASHELRTPLSAIIGYVETLVDTPDVDPATSLRFHETVLREAKRMQTLVSDLMSLSQLEAEKHDPPRETLDLGQLAARVAGQFAASESVKRVELSRPEQDIAITGDAKQLEQMLHNLIENGLKYGDPDTAVAVAVEPDGKQAKLTVIDQGAGIAAEHIPLLTRRFYRTDPGRSRAAGGTGLGLAIVKHIVERHRGRLDISSTIGQGTTVCVRFPMISANSHELS